MLYETFIPAQFTTAKKFIGVATVTPLSLISPLKFFFFSFFFFFLLLSYLFVVCASEELTRPVRGSRKPLPICPSSFRGGSERAYFALVLTSLFCASKKIGPNRADIRQCKHLYERASIRCTQPPSHPPPPGLMNID